MKKIQNKELFYHLTPVCNLESILDHSLCSRATLVNTQKQDFCDIADHQIIEKREQLDITNFVPFHFFCKNPFDIAVFKQHSNKEFCYITIKRDFAKTNNFKILAQHPLSKNTKFYDDYQEGFAQIQWDEMNDHDYNDPTCKQICMAEALSPISIDCKDFHLIVLSKENQEIQKLVESKGLWIEVYPH